MKFISLAAVAAALTLTACVEPTAPEAPEIRTPVSLSQAQKRQIEQGVRDVLKDPASAQFGAMAASRNEEDVITACGYVNARNSFGGYSGMKPFMGVITSGGGFTVAGIGSSDLDSRATINVCRKFGVAI
jgi:hypothetical protein